MGQMKSKGSLDGRVAIITGAGGGIGRTICKVLASEDAIVIATDLDASAAAEAIANLPGRYASYESHGLDVADRPAVDALVLDVISRHGRLDQMWNNAGTVNVGSMLEMELGDWRRLMAVNVDGVLNGLRAAARAMLAQEPDPATGLRGKVVNTSSVAGEEPTPVMPAYGASKAAVTHMTRTLAAELADRLICVCALYPGHLMTGLWEHIDRAWGALEGLAPGEAARRRAEQLARGRFQTLDEMEPILHHIAISKGMALNARIVMADAAVRRL